MTIAKSISRPLFIIFSLLSSAVNAQIRGKVSDENGKGLEFVSVYIENTTLGTSTNKLGEFTLNNVILPCQINFQYLGYESYSLSVSDENSPPIDVKLKPSSYILNEIKISSKSKDPAYKIIKNAIDNKERYRSNKSNYSCEAYTKGILSMLVSPKKILGKEVGNLNGNLDSTGKGILYLSESISKLESYSGKKYEEMISSKLSGSDNGFSFNRASSMDFDFYENNIEFGSSIISPLSDLALNYYNFELIGSEKINSNTNDYKIEVKPKVEATACWSGYIVIREHSWNIIELDLKIRGMQIKQPMFDSIIIKQIHIPFADENTWKVQNQQFYFFVGLLGFKAKGTFSIIYSKYKKLSQKERTNKRESFSILDSANVKSKEFWNAERPIPLTQEESIDYIKKDSLKFIRESKPYKDSMDRKNNKFLILNLLSGYTYSNSFNGFQVQFASPLNTIYFNPIQGFVLGGQIKIHKKTSKLEDYSSWSTTTKLQYGWADNRLRWQQNFTYNFDPFRYKSIKISIEDQVKSMNGDEEFSHFSNDIACLLFKNNQLKAFRERRLRVSYSQRAFYDFKLNAKSSWTQRSSLTNHTNYSISYPNRPYLANDTAKYSNALLTINRHSLLSFQLGINWQYNTQLWKTPYEINYFDSNYPVILFAYQYGYYTDLKYSFQKFELGVRHTLSLNQFGELFASYQWSRLLSAKKTQIPDALFFQTQSFRFYNTSSIQQQFLGIGLYRLIEYHQLHQWHFQYDLKGLLLDRIPWVSKLALNEFIKYSGSLDSSQMFFNEYSVGLGNIGIKAFRLLRLDYYRLYQNNKFLYDGIKIGLTSNLIAG